jgi:hypothetical protein
MRKLLLASAVMLLLGASPVMAQTEASCIQYDKPTVTVIGTITKHYSATGEAFVLSPMAITS